MSKVNLVDPNGYLEIADIWLVGQTITLEQTTDVYYIDHEVWWADGRHPIGLGVYLTDDQHHPVQPMIASAITTWEVWQKIQQRVRTRFPFRDFTMEAGVEYFFLMRDKISHFAVNSRIYIRKGDNPFPDGNLFYSDDYGDTWTSYPDDDWIFAICGTPEVPPPPPDPPIQNFATLDLQQEATETGMILTVTTNVPCHLYCYWTDHEPEKHLIPILTRGIELHTQLKMCFVDWHENDQEEAGDTLIHTFVKEPWEHCETRWLTFRAMIMGSWVAPFTEKMPPPAQWSRFHEPWGTTLNQYNKWYPWLEPDVPEVTFEDGICKITNPGYEDCGIYAVSPPPFPILQPENSDPLLISFNNTEVDINSTSSQVMIELILRKNSETFSIYLAIGLGAEYEHLKPQWTGSLPTRDYGIFYVGPGEFTKDLYALFVKFRTELGQSTDPTGWELSDVAFALGTKSPTCTDYLKSDYLTIYYTDPILPWSPSVGPIFKKHRVKPEEPTEMEFAAQHDTGYLYSPQTAWATIWAAPTGYGMEGQYTYITQARYIRTGRYQIGRGILRFDTSEIPEDKEIVSATLKIAFYRNNFPANSGDLCFVPAVGCGDEINNADYGALRENTDWVCDSIETLGLLLDTYYERDIYQAQLPIISKTGQTRIGIRAIRDINNLAPAAATNLYLNWYGDFYEALPNMDARLIVRFR